jgi:hypothetical protein
MAKLGPALFSAQSRLPLRYLATQRFASTPAAQSRHRRPLRQRSAPLPARPEISGSSNGSTYGSACLRRRAAPASIFHNFARPGTKMRRVTSGLCIAFALAGVPAAQADEDYDNGYHGYSQPQSSNPDDGQATRRRFSSSMAHDLS